MTTLVYYAVIVTMDDRFPIIEDCIYLNHAALAPLPRPVANAVIELVEQSCRHGSRHYSRWLLTEQRCRRLAAQLINAPSADDIALLKNTSEGLSTVAAGIGLQAGDNLVIPAQEFPSNWLPWQHLAERNGAVLRQVDIRAGSDPEAALLNAMDDRTRVLAVSAVQYSDGLRLDLATLGKACAGQPACFCVDAIQQLGALPLDVQACHIDCLSASAHKWLLGPEGIALFYVREELRKQLSLQQYGWSMLDDKFNFDRDDWQPSASARRYEAGSPNNLGIAGLHASLTLLLEEGLDSISAQVLDNTHYLTGQIDDLEGFEVLSPRRSGRQSGIVTFRHQGTNSGSLYKKLMQADVFSALRGDAIRWSPHFYTPRQDLERALQLVKKLTA